MCQNYDEVSRIDSTLHNTLQKKKKGGGCWRAGSPPAARSPGPPLTGVMGGGSRPAAILKGESSGTKRWDEKQF